MKKKLGKKKEIGNFSYRKFHNIFLVPQNHGFVPTIDYDY